MPTRCYTLPVKACIAEAVRFNCNILEASELLKNKSLIVPNAIGVSPGEGTGATMSDDEDDQADSDTNLFDGSLDGPDSMGFGPLVPTETERSLMERVRHELKHELKQVYVEKAFPFC